MDTTTILIAGAAGLIIGFIIAKFLEKGRAKKTVGNAKKEAAIILKNAQAEGENIKKDKIFQAKEKFLELKAEHEKVIINKDKKISEAEKRARDKESQISSELAKNKKLNEQYESKIKDLDHRVELYEKKHTE